MLVCELRGEVLWDWEQTLEEGCQVSVLMSLMGEGQIWLQVLENLHTKYSSCQWNKQMLPNEKEEFLGWYNNRKPNRKRKGQCLVPSLAIQSLCDSFVRADV